MLIIQKTTKVILFSIKYLNQNEVRGPETSLPWVGENISFEQSANALV